MKHGITNDARPNGAMRSRSMHMPKRLARPICTPLLQTARCRRCHARSMPNAASSTPIPCRALTRNVVPPNCLAKFACCKTEPASFNRSSGAPMRNCNRPVRTSRRYACTSLRTETSTFWSMTAPLRNLGRRFPAAARLTRRTAKAIWWTVTLQIGRRLQARRQLFIAEAERRGLGTITAIRPIPAVTVPTDTKIRVASATDPIVSVIIPTFGQVDYTLRCLASLSERTPRTAIEVIVMDDAYPGPEIFSLREKVDGIRFRSESGEPRVPVDVQRSCQAGEGAIPILS